VVQYRVNAGKLPPDHWAIGPQGGGRLIGEACHMIDLLSHLVGRPRTDHSIQLLVPPAGRSDLPLGDNFILHCRYADGSLTTLTYTSLGDADAGKERVELHWDGKSAVADDFRSLRLHGTDADDQSRERPDKGHLEMLRRFIEHASSGGPEPIPWEEALDVSRFVLDLDAEIRGQTA
jgi:predicted dehydrogenase